MLYYLDTAHLDSIQQAMECFPLSGVTTNPSIISKECQPLGTLLRDIRSCIGPSRMLFAQVIAREAEQMVREADALRQWCGPSFSVKIPATVQGLKAVSYTHLDVYKRQRTACASASMTTAWAAPRLIASHAIAPLPPNRSNTQASRVLAARMPKTASRTTALVGRVNRPVGVCKIRPRAVPPAIFILDSSYRFL